MVTLKNIQIKNWQNLREKQTHPEQRFQRCSSADEWGGRTAVATEEAGAALSDNLT